MSNYKHFVSLCESIMQEASTGMAAFTSPAAQEVLKYLHKSENLGHDVAYEPVSRISWQTLKDKSDSWFILEGESGFAALRFYSPRGNNVGVYTVITSAGKPDMVTGKVVSTEKVNTATEGNELLKRTIGKIQKSYFVKTSYSVNLRKSRDSNKRIIGTNTGPVDAEYFVKRFKPLFKQALVKTMADVKGAINNAVKNDAYDYANKKVGYLGRLQGALNELESGNINDIIKAAINNSITMTARYYYPEETGEIRHGYGFRNSGLVPEMYDGTRQVLADIGQGDKEKLSAVLAYFKRNLIS